MLQDTAVNGLSHQLIIIVVQYYRNEFEFTLYITLMIGTDYHNILLLVTARK